MRQPQVLIHERDGRLTAFVRAVLEARGLRWTVREPRDLERELTLLERVAWLHPEAATVFVGDVEHAPLAGIAWDLGVRYVYLPPQPRELLPDLVIQLMGEGT